VKVRSDDASARDEFDQGFTRFHRFEGGEPDPARRRVGLEPFEERHEALSPAPERSEVNPAEDDLRDPLLAEGVDRLLDLGQGGALLTAAERRNYAERATPAASVLDLQKRARSPGSRRPRQRRAKDLLGGNAESGDLPGEEPRRHLLYQADERGRRTVPRDEIDLRPPRETVRVALGEASRNGEDCSRILPAEAPYLPERVAVGALRDSAGVEDHDVGGLSGMNAKKARGLENTCQLAGLDLADLATENMNGIASRGASGQAVRTGKRR
jgi:hypothetical protein